MFKRVQHSCFGVPYLIALCPDTNQGRLGFGLTVLASVGKKAAQQVSVVGEEGKTCIFTVFDNSLLKVMQRGFHWKRNQHPDTQHFKD